MILCFFHLVVWIHFCHHSFFQKVEGQHLQHVKLMGHFRFDWSISSNDVLKHKNKEWFASNKVEVWGQNLPNY